MCVYVALREYQDLRFICIFEDLEELAFLTAGSQSHSFVNIKKINFII